MLSALELRKIANRAGYFEDHVDAVREVIESLDASESEFWIRVQAVDQNERRCRVFLSPEVRHTLRLLLNKEYELACERQCKFADRIDYAGKVPESGEAWE